MDVRVLIVKMKRFVINQLQCYSHVRCNRKFDGKNYQLIEEAKVY